MSKQLVLPPPIPAKRLSAHARRAARAFERVHETLAATAVGGRVTATRRAAPSAYNLSVEPPGTDMTLVYDDGVFKPQGPVPAGVKNHAVVHVVIVDEAEGANVAVAERWKAIDRLTGLADDEGGPTDVAQNHDKYLYGSLRPR